MLSQICLNLTWSQKEPNNNVISVFRESDNKICENGYIDLHLVLLREKNKKQVLVIFGQMIVKLTEGLNICFCIEVT